MVIMLFREILHVPDIRPAPINPFKANVSINLMMGKFTLNGLKGSKNSSLS